MKTPTTDPNPAVTPEAPSRPLAWAAALAVPCLAALADVLLWTAARAAGADLEVATGGSTHEVGVGAVVAGALVSGLAGVLLLRLALRVTARGRRWWTIGALAVLALSLLSPLAQAETATTAMVLVGLHLLTGAVVVTGLRRVTSA